MDKQQGTRSTRGETLIETLVATLIIALTSVLLLSMSMAAVRLNLANNAVGEKGRTELAVAEKGAALSAQPRVGKVVVQVTGGASYEYEVTYSSPVGQLNTYERKPGEDGS